jgi:oligopeptide/dipeptide ABC transporter ATP-binding protein
LSENRLSPALRGGPEGALLWVDRLEKSFALRRDGRGPREELRAVDGVSFDVRAGETLGLVGESGCGKTTIARCVLRLVEPNRGSVVFDNSNVLALGAGELRRLRRRMQMVFQDPFSSLDPRMSVRSIVEEPLLIHGIADARERAAQAREILTLVGIAPEQMSRKPHEFSVGQRQRIGIARALVLHPEFVALDEPVSALDVSIQAQVLNLLRDLQQRLGLTYLFIVHDLAVAEYFCDRVAVLYLGSVVEFADRETLFRRPLHPYTVALLSAVPVPDPASERRRRRIVLRGEVLPVAGARVGCRFRARCPVGRDREVCAAEEPPLAEHERGHWAACHFPAELAAS